MVDEMSLRDPRTDPQYGDIVRSTVHKNGRERHVMSRAGSFVQYKAVSPTNTRMMTCWIEAWKDWCINSKTEIVQRGVV